MGYKLNTGWVWADSKFNCQHWKKCCFFRKYIGQNMSIFYNKAFVRTRKLRQFMSRLFNQLQGGSGQIQSLKFNCQHWKKDFFVSPLAKICPFSTKMRKKICSFEKSVLTYNHVCEMLARESAFRFFIIDFLVKIWPFWVFDNFSKVSSNNGSKIV